MPSHADRARAVRDEECWLPNIFTDTQLWGMVHERGWRAERIRMKGRRGGLRRLYRFEVRAADGALLGTGSSFQTAVVAALRTFHGVKW